MVALLIMKLAIFGHIIYDTAFVYIVLVSVYCIIGYLATGQSPDFPNYAQRCNMHLVTIPLTGLYALAYWTFSKK